MENSILSPAETKRNILEDVAQRHGVRESDILKPDRRKEIVAARAEAMRRLYEYNKSYSETARIFGVDHTTVMYHVRNVI